MKEEDEGSLMEEIDRIAAKRDTSPVTMTSSSASTRAMMFNNSQNRGRMNLRRRWDGKKNEMPQ